MIFLLPDWAIRAIYHGLKDFWLIAIFGMKVGMISAIITALLFLFQAEREKPQITG